MINSQLGQVIRYAVAVALGALLVVAVQRTAMYVAVRTAAPPTRDEAADDLLRRATKEQDISRKGLALAALNSTHGFTRFAAWEYCRALVVVEAIPVAQRIVLSETNSDIVSDAVTFLGQMRDDELADIYLRDSDRISETRRAQVAEILGGVVSDLSERALHKLSGEPSVSVREQANLSLWKIARHRFNVDMYFTFRERTPVSRLNAVIMGLTAIGDERCRTELRRLTLHELQDIRALADHGLKLIARRDPTGVLHPSDRE
ncbi:MAG: hypothetical protein HRU74_07100 [Chthonomonadaceae bacterium]|nr:MAG: hypothetical protein HRU74_07100 [Chthonomonadaceae bacterium]